MERGTYIQGWYKNNHCYHPGLPYRSLQMIEELERVGFFEAPASAAHPRPISSFPRLIRASLFL